MLTIPLLRLYRNSEFIRYNKNVVTVCLQNNAAGFQLAAQTNALQTSLLPLDELFMVEKANAHTAALADLDSRRDKATLGLRALGEAYSYHFLPEMANAGSALLAGIDKYGKKISTMNYVAETEILSSLAHDLSTIPELTAAVQLLHAVPWVQELNTANELFNEKYLTRTETYAAKPQGSIADYRLAAMEQYRLLAAHITAHDTLTPSAGLTKLINELNSLTDQYNQLVTDRGSNEAAEPQSE
jgi:Family of unknown function (DUF6261)